MAPVKLSPAERVVLLHCCDSPDKRELLVSELMRRVEATYGLIGKNYKQANGISKAISRAMKKLRAMGLLDLVFCYHGRNVRSRVLADRTAAALENEEEFSNLHESMIDSLSQSRITKSVGHALLGEGILNRDSFREAKRKELECLAQSGRPSERKRAQKIALTKEGHSIAARVKLEERELAVNIEDILTSMRGRTLSDQAIAIARFMICSGRQHG